MGIEVDGDLLDYDATGVDPQVAALLLQDTLAVMFDLEDEGFEYEHAVTDDMVVARVNLGVIGAVGYDTSVLADVTAKDIVVGGLAEARQLRREMVAHLRGLADRIEEIDEAANVARLNREETPDA